MKSNYHTHSTWCDGADTPRRMVEAALARGFVRLGFTSHAMFPAAESFTLAPERAKDYVAEIRALAEEYRGRIEILCGFEADYLPGVTAPDRARYAEWAPDYLIGSIHWVRAADSSTGTAAPSAARTQWMEPIR